MAATVPPPADSDPDRLAGPRITPLFTQLLEQEAARRGLPPEPWAPWNPMQACPCGGTIVFGLCQDCLYSPGQDDQDYAAEYDLPA